MASRIWCTYYFRLWFECFFPLGLFFLAGAHMPSRSMVVRGFFLSRGMVYLGFKGQYHGAPVHASLQIDTPEGPYVLYRAKRSTSNNNASLLAFISPF